MKLEWNSLSKEKFVKAASARTQQLQTTSKAGARLSKIGAMALAVRNCAQFCSPKFWKVDIELSPARNQYPRSSRSLMLREVLSNVTSTLLHTTFINYFFRVILFRADFCLHPRPLANCNADCHRAEAAITQVLRRCCVLGGAGEGERGGERLCVVVF